VVIRGFTGFEVRALFTCAIYSVRFRRQHFTSLKSTKGCPPPTLVLGPRKIRTYFEDRHSQVTRPFQHFNNLNTYLQYK